jgi:hypothetical protein
MQQFTIQKIEDELLKSSHKQVRAKWNRIYEGIYVLWNENNSNHLNLVPFKVHNKKLDDLFGQDNIKWIKEHILVEHNIGVFFEDTKKKSISEFTWRNDILKEMSLQIPKNKRTKILVNRITRSKFENFKEINEHQLKEPVINIFWAGGLVCHYYEVADSAQTHIDRDFLDLHEILSPLTPFNFKDYGAKEDASGRIYCTETYIPNSRKKLLYRGCWNYDIEASAPTLLSQHYRELTGCDTPAINHYINNKSELRQEWAELTGCDSDSIKDVINFICNGARVPSKSQLQLPNCPQFSVLKSLGSSPALAKYRLLRLLADTQFTTLAAELEVVFKKLISIYKQPNSKVITNKAGYTKECINKEEFMSIDTSESDEPMDIRIKGGQWNSNVACQHIYVGLERIILNVVLDYLVSNNIGCLPIHDGFISDRRINTEYLQNLVLEKTGYKIIFSEEQY